MTTSQVDSPAARATADSLTMRERAVLMAFFFIGADVNGSENPQHVKEDNMTFATVADLRLELGKASKMDTATVRALCGTLTKKGCVSHWEGNELIATDFGLDVLSTLRVSICFRKNFAAFVRELY